MGAEWEGVGGLTDFWCLCMHGSEGRVTAVEKICFKCPVTNGMQAWTRTERHYAAAGESLSTYTPHSHSHAASLYIHTAMHYLVCTLTHPYT